MLPTVYFVMRTVLLSEARDTTVSPADLGWADEWIEELFNIVQQGLYQSQKLD